MRSNLIQLRYNWRDRVVQAVVKVSRSAVQVKDLLRERRNGKSLSYILITFNPGLTFSELYLTVFTCQANHPAQSRIYYITLFTSISSHLLHHIGREKAKTRDENHQLNWASNPQSLQP